jgi:hypothetical protein
MIETKEDFESELKPIMEYKLVIPIELYQRLLAYVDNCEDEISGLADVEYNSEDGVFSLSEVYLVKQEVSSASTEMDGDAITKLYSGLIKEGKTQMPRLWWHSHADMSTFWSKTDEDTMIELKNESYTIALEFNHAHDILCRLIQWQPFPLVVDDIEIVVDYSLMKTPKAVLNEIQSKVVKRVSTFTYTTKDKTSNENDFVNRNGAKGVLYCMLPKDVIQANNKIVGLKLTEMWDYALQEWVWKQPNSNVRWRDLHKVFGDDFTFD